MTSNSVSAHAKGGPEIARGQSISGKRFMDQFTEWYNHEHRHSGIGLHTPADIHYGLAEDRDVQRRAVLENARAQHPHRFSTERVVPKILALPDAAWINQPADEPDTDRETTIAA
ncbi:hypothetical protein [Williamsia muralis]|uniref:hypothetical protein n=1 Tax=Williamsia marianensis TaxID=85044 RepID=UPI0037DCBAD5